MVSSFANFCSDCESHPIAPYQIRTFLIRLTLI